MWCASKLRSASLRLIAMAPIPGNFVCFGASNCNLPSVVWFDRHCSGHWQSLVKTQNTILLEATRVGFTKKCEGQSLRQVAGRLATSLRWKLALTTLEIPFCKFSYRNGKLRDGLGLQLGVNRSHKSSLSFEVERSTSILSVEWAACLRYIRCYWHWRYGALRSLKRCSNWVTHAEFGTHLLETW